MSAPQKIHDPETGVYVGLIWENRDGWVRAEDRDAVLSDDLFPSQDDAIDWLDERWAAHPLNAKAA